MNACPLVLASASPRRRAFVELLALPFDICAAHVDEQNGPGEPPQALVARLSREKARAVAALHPRATVIGADTVVVLDGTILGKPVDADDARDMLCRLRGRSHQVYSGVAVCAPYHPVPLTAVVGSTVGMRSYGDDEIAAYIASGSPLDKAGAYGIQDAVFHPVAWLRGCYASVMGLSLCRLAGLLARVGVVGNVFAQPVDVPGACSAFTGVHCCGGQECEMALEGLETTQSRGAGEKRRGSEERR